MPRQMSRSNLRRSLVRIAKEVQRLSERAIESSRISPTEHGDICDAWQALETAIYAIRSPTRTF